MAVHHFKLGGKTCWTAPVGAFEAAHEKRVVFLPGDETFTRMLPEIQAILESGAPCNPFLLACFESSNWEADLTPWEAPPLFKRSAPFLGRAGETLAWMRASFMPQVFERHAIEAGPERRLGIAGYSLGGLFALWALCEGGLFGCCASCSGSLWYNGWPAFMENHPPPRGSRIFLSLGKTEEHAKNHRMAAVGEVTRQAARLYGESPNVAEVALQWNEGGHFDDVPGRLAQALAWMATRL